MLKLARIAVLGLLVICSRVASAQITIEDKEYKDASMVPVSTPATSILSIRGAQVDIGAVRTYGLRVLVGATIGPNAKPGQAVYMKGPGQPVFLSHKGVRAKATGRQKQAITLRTVSYDGADSDTQSSSFVFNAEACFGIFASGGVLMANEDYRRRVSRSVYFSATVMNGFDTLDERPELIYDNKTTLDGSDSERLHSFVTQNGSHYVKTVYYGYSILVRAEVIEDNVDERRKLKVMLKGGFGPFSAKSELSQDVTRALTSGKIAIRAVVIGGRVNKESMALIPSVDKLFEFIELYRSGEIVIEPGPVEAELISYASVLAAKSEISKLLAGEIYVTDSREVNTAKKELLAALDERLVPLESKVAKITDGWFLIQSELNGNVSTYVLDVSGGKADGHPGIILVGSDKAAPNRKWRLILLDK